MRRIVIRYEESYEQWLNQILYALQQENIKQCYEISNNIFISLKDCVTNFLFQQGYKPRDGQEYRKDLIKRLKRIGIEFEIYTNYILWEYLSAFTDVLDYSKCFVIQFVIHDFEKVNDKFILSKNENEEFIIGTRNTATLSNYNKKLCNELVLLKKKYENNEVAIDILKILEKIILEDYM